MRGVGIFTEGLKAVAVSFELAWSRGALLPCCACHLRWEANSSSALANKKRLPHRTHLGLADGLDSLSKVLLRFGNQSVGSFRFMAGADAKGPLEVEPSRSLSGPARDVDQTCLKRWPWRSTRRQACLAWERRPFERAHRHDTARAYKSALPTK